MEGLPVADRAQALEGVEIEPHAQVEHLPALEAADLQVPPVPLPDPQPEIVGVGAADVRPADRLIARPDQLDLPLNELLRSRAYVGVTRSSIRACCFQYLIRPERLGPSHGRGELLVGGVDPSPAREADDEALAVRERRHVRPLHAVKRQPQRPST